MADLTPKTGEFKIATIWGEEPVKGLIVGEFGISSVGLNVWRITHLRTGATLGDYKDWKTRAAAIRVAQKLMKNPAPWRHGRFGNVPKTLRAAWTKAAYGYLLEAVKGEDRNRA